MRYFRFRWEKPEDADDAHLAGSSWYYEFNADGMLARQIVRYMDGTCRRYGPDDVGDAGGEFRRDVRQDELDMSQGEEITGTAFEELWHSAT